MKTTLWALVCIVLVILIVVFSRSGKKEAVAPTDTTPSTSTTVTTPETTSTVTPATDTLKVTTTKEGTGPESVVGDEVSMNYTGMLTDGTVFDSNILPKFGHVEAFTFTLGQNHVIAGWEKGVLGMKKGEKRHLVIPASLGYGASGTGPIPGNATLVFDVELVAISHK